MNNVSQLFPHFILSIPLYTPVPFYTIGIFFSSVKFYMNKHLLPLGCEPATELIFLS